MTEGGEFEADNSDDELDADVIFTETESRTADNFAPDLRGSDDANEDGQESGEHDRFWPKFQGGDYGNGLPHLEGGNVIVFVNTSSVHRLRVHYCQCPNAKRADRQFVNMGFLPASVMKLKTAFTFRVLDDFHLTNLQHCWYIILAQDSLEDIQHLPSIGTSTYHLGASLCHLIGVRITTGNSCDVNTYGDK